MADRRLRSRSGWHLRLLAAGQGLAAFGAGLDCTLAWACRRASGQRRRGRVPGGALVRGSPPGATGPGTSSSIVSSVRSIRRSPSVALVAGLSLALSLACWVRCRAWP